MEAFLEKDPTRWNREISHLPFHHVLQTSQWGEVKSLTGWQAERWLFEDSGQTKAAALVLTRRSARGFLAVQYVPKGPALDYADPVLLDSVLGHLERNARGHGALFVKIDPDVVLDSPLGEGVTRHLRERGWVPSREQVQFPNTMVLDLTPDEESLLAAMKQKTRYNIRLAMRRGVSVRSGGREDLPVFYALYSATAERDGFVIRPFGYYRRVWETFLDAGMGHLLLAEVEGEPVAGVFLFRFAEKRGISTERRHRSIGNSCRTTCFSGKRSGGQSPRDAPFTTSGAPRRSFRNETRCGGCTDSSWALERSWNGTSERGITRCIQRCIGSTTWRCRKSSISCGGGRVVSPDEVFL